MADESMIRTLAAQAEALWPQELPLLRRYALTGAPRILDAGCGTGEVTRRLGEEFPHAMILGVDVLDQSLERARLASAHLGTRVCFENRSIFGLGLPEASFDLTVCRHVLHAIPVAQHAIAELVRVTRPGGYVHLLAEDYGMIHFPKRRLDPAPFWSMVPVRFGAATGTDLFIGRRVPAILRELGLGSLSTDFLVVDPLRVRRETFAAIWEAWRDGYTEAISRYCGIPPTEAAEHFDDQIASIRDPNSYAAWLVPVVAGVVRGRSAR